MMSQPLTAGDDVSNKTPRLPRWTRQEILVLIQGKRVTEKKGLTGRVGSEPKWVSVSSYCKRHGVNRGPIQCRKRWSNLSGDYKKIKEWESKVKDDDMTDSFWLMRNDLRRERKLPGFFDKEVFDILDGDHDVDVQEDVALALALIPSTEDLFHSAADEGLFSDNEQQDEEEGCSKDDNNIPDAVPVSAVPVSVAEKQYESLPKESPVRGTTHEKQPIPETEVGNTEERRKRKRHTSTSGEERETKNLDHTLLLEALEKNGQMLRSQLEAQNTNLQLDREQRKEQADSLISVLNKIADAVGRVADKL